MGERGRFGPSLPVIFLLNYMETLPKEIVNHILDYTLSCKKDNIYFINKFITNILVEKHKKCEPVLCFGRYICYDCHNTSLKFINMLKFNYYY